MTEVSSCLHTGAKGSQVMLRRGNSSAPMSNWAATRFTQPGVLSAFMVNTLIYGGTVSPQIY